MTLAFLLLLGLMSFPQMPSAAGQPPQSVLLLDNFTFDPGTIYVEPGENVSMMITIPGSLPHTFTVFAQPDVQIDYTNFAELNAYYEENERLTDVWLSGGESGWVNFTAPTLEGRYPIVCMIVGHAGAGMVGTLVVGEPGEVGPSGFVWSLGLVQTMLVVTLIGVAVFAVYYHLRTTRT